MSDGWTAIDRHSFLFEGRGGMGPHGSGEVEFDDFIGGTLFFAAAIYRLEAVERMPRTIFSGKKSHILLLPPANSNFFLYFKMLAAGYKFLGLEHNFMDFLFGLRGGGDTFFGMFGFRFVLGGKFKFN